MDNILLIEDDFALSNGVKFALQNTECNIIQCFNLKEAREIDMMNIALAILDINLPDGNGHCYWFRAWG